MAENAPYQQLQMVWPEQLLSRPPAVCLVRDYALRTYCPGDEPAFYTLLDRVGWPGWDDVRLQSWMIRIPPGSWFMVVHAATRAIVATAMGLHDHTDLQPFGGEVGWVACDPEHRGHGLGMAVSAAVTARLIAAGYTNIHLYTEDYRLAALKTYFKLGYVPLVYAPDMLVR